MSRLRAEPGVMPCHAVYVVLREQIERGDLAAGAQLPTEPQLATRFGVSRGAVRRALARLEQEGRLLRLPARGTFVRDAGGNDASMQRVRALLESYHDLDRFSQVRVLEFALRPTPAAVLARCPGLGVQTLLIRRARGLGSCYFALATHYVPERLASAIRGRSDTRPTAVAFEASGLNPGRGEQSIVAIAADPDSAPILEVPLGAPLLLARRTLRTRCGRILEYQEAVYRPDLYQIRTGLAWRADEAGGVHWVPTARVRRR